jgi:G3E family GTPase
VGATPTTLVTGASAAAREAAIAAALTEGTDTALILEGLPSGITRLDNLLESPHLHIARIAPGCLCCTGNLTMRVTLNRMLRLKPARLFISVASTEHVDGIHRFLTQPPYDDLLVLTKDLPA